MPINNCELNFFDYVARTPELNLSVPLEKLTVKDLRKIFLSQALLGLCGEYADVRISKQFVTGRDGYEIPITIFNDDLTDNTLPVLIMYPGSGYILDAFEISAIAFSRIAKLSGIKVIMPIHRLAPEYPLPIPIYDCYDVAKYIATNSHKFKINSNKIFIGGLSSGAHAATVVTNLACRDPDLRIVHQILLNGIYDALKSNSNYDEYTLQDKWTTKEGSEFMVSNWGVDPQEYNNPLISPLYTTYPAKTPATIIVGEYDGLRNDSEAYFLRLKEAGNNCKKIVLAGQSHITMCYRVITNEGIDPAQVIADVIRNHEF